MTMNVVVVEDKQNFEISIICDSGSHVHMTSLKEDLKNTGTANRSCMSGNKGQLLVLSTGETPLRLNVQRKEALIKVVLKGVLCKGPHS